MWHHIMGNGQHQTGSWAQKAWGRKWQCMTGCKIWMTNVLHITHAYISKT